MFAFFNNTPLEVKQQGNGVTWNFYGPTINLPMPPGLEARRAELQEKINELQASKGSGEALKREISKLSNEKEAIKPPSTLVMKEISEPRDTKIMLRGNYLTLGDSVAVGTPTVMHAYDKKLPANRLGFAKWLVAPANPLMSRVTVNRWWAAFMEHGIVATQEDFGAQGEAPTHQGLLDWLAVEFVESGWSMKHIHRLIVTSRTYRRSSRVSGEHLEQDPANRYFARASRVRMSAEMVRDSALVASGLLSHRMHGPPIYPPQPSGIWRHVGRNAPQFIPAKDENRFLKN